MADEGLPKPLHHTSRTESIVGLPARHLSGAEDGLQGSHGTASDRLQGQERITSIRPSHAPRDETKDEDFLSDQVKGTSFFLPLLSYYLETVLQRGNPNAIFKGRAGKKTAQNHSGGTHSSLPGRHPVLEPPRPGVLGKGHHTKCVVGRLPLSPDLLLHARDLT